VPNGEHAQLEIRVHFAALVAALIRGGPDWVDALEALWDWSEEWLDIDREQLEEELDIDA
jgi:hypothetical protein